MFRLAACWSLRKQLGDLFIGGNCFLGILTFQTRGFIKAALTVILNLRCGIFLPERMDSQYSAENPRSDWNPDAASARNGKRNRKQDHRYRAANARVEKAKRAK